MGWANGSILVEKIAKTVASTSISASEKRDVFSALILGVIDLDCDTLDECRGLDPILDEVIDQIWGFDEYDDDDYEEE